MGAEGLPVLGSPPTLLTAVLVVMVCVGSGLGAIPDSGHPDAACIPVTLVWCGPSFALALSLAIQVLFFVVM